MRTETSANKKKSYFFLSFFFHVICLMNTKVGSYRREFWGLRGRGSKDLRGVGKVSRDPSTSPLTKESHCPPQSLTAVRWGQGSRMSGPILQLRRLSSRQILWLAQGHTGSWHFLEHRCGPTQSSEEAQGRASAHRKRKPDVKTGRGFRDCLRFEKVHPFGISVCFGLPHSVLVYTCCTGFLPKYPC